MYTICMGIVCTMYMLKTSSILDQSLTHITNENLICEELGIVAY